MDGPDARGDGGVKDSPCCVGGLARLCEEAGAFLESGRPKPEAA